MFLGQAAVVRCYRVFTQLFRQCCGRALGQPGDDLGRVAGLHLANDLQQLHLLAHPGPGLQHLPDGDGMSLLEAVIESDTEVAVIMMTGSSGSISLMCSMRLWSDSVSCCIT